MRYLLDADWVIDALVDRRNAAETLTQLSPEGIAISLVTVGEIYEGAYGHSDPQAHLATLREFLHPLHKLNLNNSIVERFAETRAFLRSRGQIISDFDILLAATALHHDLTVLTRNLRHFSRIPDLKLYQSKAA
jgi:predicted nucleic acid-binding protein